MEKEPITASGFETLKKELESLKSVKRPEVIKAIAEARGHGDLKENAEYHAAKEQQALIESRVITINDLIKFSRFSWFSPGGFVFTGGLSATGGLEAGDNTCSRVQR